MAKFDLYATLLVDWQSRMNLVGPSTLTDIWDRHFADSAQLAPLAGVDCRAPLVGVERPPLAGGNRAPLAGADRRVPPAEAASRQWLDIGSGAGFPAIVLALLVPGHFHLVEATAKKCRFLETVVAALNLGATTTIHNARIESLPPVAADVVTARACAGLAQLFDWGYTHGRRATWLLLKGRTAAAEVNAARASFDFAAELVPSRTDGEARIVVARDVRRVR